MTRTRLVLVVCIALALQFTWAGSSVLHAQRSRGAPRIDEVRVINLGQRELYQLGVDGSGNVRIASSDELVGIDLDGSVPVHSLMDFAVLSEFPVAAAISSDGTILAGQGPTPAAFYFEAMWWNAFAPSVAHGLGGDFSLVCGVENTPSGVVMVGAFDGRPIDFRPNGGGYLPTLSPSQDGSARAVSADGSVYCGWLVPSVFHTTAVRWVDRVPEALQQSAGAYSEALGVSRNGANIAGEESGRPVLWLAQDGLALRFLVDHDGVPFSGAALGVLDDGFAFGEGWRGSERFGWVWHPSYGTDSVTRFDDWLTQWNVAPIHVEGVRDVHATKRSFHFALYGGPVQDSWYVQTPKQP